MAFRANAGRIWITDAADAILVFDSNEKLFNGLQYIAGSITLPRRRSVWNGDLTPINVNNNWALANASGSSDLMGSVRISGSNAYGPTNYGWFALPGSLVMVWDAIGSYDIPAQRELADLKAAYTFFISGGVLYLNERVALKAQPMVNVDTTATLNPVTLDYKIYCGTFT